MKKNVVQDVVPPKKSIRNVTLPSRGASFGSIGRDEKVVPSKHKVEDDEFTRPVVIKQFPQAPIRIEQQVEPKTPPPPPPRPPIDIPSYKYEYDEPKKPKRLWLYASGALLLLAVVFGISAFFKSAVVRVTPKQEVQVINETLQATKDATAPSLGFQVVTVSKDVEKSVNATGQAQVDTKAQGQIVIYNETSQVQKLVATTRFQTPEGLIYRIVAAATIPAKTVKNGTPIAGSVTATVQADKSGSSYNIGLEDFTIPGFKGDPKYQTIYGRSKTAMTGGFSGMQKVVSKDDVTAADTELGASLKSSLAADITKQIPANFILYPQSLVYNLNPVEQVDSSSTQAVLKKTGTVSAVIFDKSLLSSAILSGMNPAMSPDLVKITNLDSLTFAYNNNFSPASDTGLSFTLSGNANLVYIFDQNKLKTDLLGLSRSKASAVLATYQTIKEAWVETHPFWNQTIPSDPNKVTIVNTLTE